MMHREYKIDLTLRAPVLSHAIGSTAFGVDMAMQRYHDCYALNGTQLRGLIRHALEGFADRMGKDGEALRRDLHRWFGKASAGHPELAPARARLSFDYAWLLTSEHEPNDQPRYRVGLDEALGTVARGNLQVIEAPFKVGDAPTFSGRITARLDDEQEATRLADWLNRALQYIPALGALKGVGFGKLEQHEIHSSRIETTPLSLDLSATQLALALTLDRPLCISRPHRPNDNLFESESFIPGAAVIGVLARTVAPDIDEGRGEDVSERLREAICIDQLRVLHALPQSSCGVRSAPLPLSLAHYNDALCDLALKENPKVRQQGGQYWAPAFSPDWKGKHWEAASDHLAAHGWPLAPLLDRHLSVHTAINRSSGAAADGQLFSLDCVDDQATRWCTRIELSEVPDRQRAQVAKRLSELLGAGLKGIGKTKANAGVVLDEVSQELPRSGKAAEQGVHVVVLRTAARLMPAGVKLRGTNGHKLLHDAYAEYWQQASGGALALSHYYAQQTLAGGEFHHRYYGNNGDDYAPEWLSVPGSVFVLHESESSDVAEKVLQGWLDHGLPSASGRRGKEHWKRDPYIRQNGYGEVIIDHPIHWAGNEGREGAK